MKATSLHSSTASELFNKPNALLQPFDFTPLNRVIFGAGSLSRLGEFVRELGGWRVLLVTDPGLERAGHPQRAQKLMREAGLEVFVFDEVRENPTNKQVEVGVNFARGWAIDIIVAIGGGSSMDCAKGINFLLTNGGKMADYKGFGKATKPMLPSIGIPTTSGTGSEAQSYALITDASSHLKMACGDKKAAFRIAILDPELTVSQPRHVAAVTGIDAIAHAVESYVCTKRTPVSQVYSLEAFRNLEPNLQTALSEPDNLDARSAVQIGSHFAGVAIENAMLGICHSCSNPLTAHYGITHGTAIGMLLPHVIRFNAPVAEHMYADLTASNSLGNGEPASEILAQRITELIAFAGLPNRLRDCGVSESILHILAEEARQQWTANFNPRPVTEEDLLSVYQSAW
ncbi:MAG: iron-containing alcohol dehydrogenase [Planctomycetes bacterium]|nr:iron-containing alcohol dehydrogenase [Planctomycetota bacterium]